MIIGKEGQPRSGKSYEAVKFDVLEALRAERKVYARINGLNHEAIAKHLGKPVDRVAELLIVMTDQQVLEWCVCETADDGSLDFPHIEHKALIVIDEVHEYWPTSRQAVQKTTADFFAKHGHVGLDIVLLSQNFKEVHRSVVRRMQRKNVYTKLDALGKDQSYSVRFYSAATAEKFELMGSEKRDYDPDVFPLYHGIQPGVEGQTVYKTGSRTLWQTARKPAIFVAAAVLLGVFFIGRFFFGGAVGETPEPVKQAAETVQGQRIGTPTLPATSSTTGTLPVHQQQRVSRKEPPEVAYLLELSSNGRARYLGQVGGRYVVEFRATAGGHVLDRFTDRQLVALGWRFKPMGYGAKIERGDHALIFTPWPIDLPGQQSTQTADRIRAAGVPLASASEQPPPPAVANTGNAIVSGNAAGGSYGQVASYGAMGYGPNAGRH